MKKVLSLVLIASLAACGGGGGDDSPAAPPAPKPDGMWVSETQSSANWELMIVDNGEFWDLSVSDGDYSVLGGTVVAQGQKLTGSGVESFDNMNFPFSLTGDFVEGKSLSVTANFGKYGVFTERYVPGALNGKPWAPRSGTYSGYTQLGARTSITVTNGTFRGNTGPCSFDGVFTQTNNAWNRVSWTFHGGACVLGTQTVRGVIAGNDTTFSVMLKNSAGEMVGAIYVK